MIAYTRCVYSVKCVRGRPKLTAVDIVVGYTVFTSSAVITSFYGRNTASGGASYRQDIGPRPYHFRSGPTSGPTRLPLGQETKKVKFPWSIVLLSRKVILSV